MASVVGVKSNETFSLSRWAEVGRGAEGIVYRVRGERVVKVFTSPLTDVEVGKVTALAALAKKAPGFAWPLETVADQAGRVVGVVMPLAAGETLESILDDRRTAGMDVVHKVRVGLHVSHATSAAHALSGPRVVLGDVLKGGNLVIGSDRATFVDTPSVTLFGYRRADGGSADSVSRLSTPGSVPPEVLANPAALPSHSADLFALAVLLFELFFGRPPTEPRPAPAAVALDPDDAVRRGMFFRYVRRPDFEAPTYDTIDVPPDVDDLFRAAFLAVAARPSAERWVTALTEWLDRLTPPPAPAADDPADPDTGWVWPAADRLAIGAVAVVLAVSGVRLLLPSRPTPPPPGATEPALPPAPAKPVGPGQFQELYR